VLSRYERLTACSQILHIGINADQHLQESGPSDFEDRIDWTHRVTKKRSHETVDILWRRLCQAYIILARTASPKQVRQVQAVYRREKKIEFREDYFDTMPGMEIDKQIDQLLGKSPGIYSEDVIEWNPPIPEYPFLEQARIVDAFSALMLSHSMEKEHLLDGFRSSPIWRRFVSYANRPVAETRSKWRRPPTLFHTQTSKPHRSCRRFRHGHRRTSAPSVSLMKAF
jgi:hypothetical protein